MTEQLISILAASIFGLSLAQGPGYDAVGSISAEQAAEEGLVYKASCDCYESPTRRIRLVHEELAPLVERHLRAEFADPAYRLRIK